MKRTLGCVLSLAIVGSAGAQTSSGSGSQGSQGAQGGSSSQDSSASQAGSGSQGSSTSQAGKDTQGSSSSQAGKDTQGSSGSQAGTGSQASPGSQSDKGSQGTAPQARQGPPRSRAKAKSGQKFRASLDPSNEVPAPNVGAATPSGSADFTMDGPVIVYHVRVVGLTSPMNSAEIHSGAPGEAGPVVVVLPLSPGSTAGTAEADGKIDASQINAKNPDGSPMSMDDLVDAMSSGHAYVNVPTQQNTRGEIRGAISNQGP